MFVTPLCFPLLYIRLIYTHCPSFQASGSNLQSQCCCHTFHSSYFFFVNSYKPKRQIRTSVLHRFLRIDRSCSNEHVQSHDQFSFDHVLPATSYIQSVPNGSPYWNGGNGWRWIPATSNHRKPLPSPTATTTATSFLPIFSADRFLATSYLPTTHRFPTFAILSVR